MLGVKFFSGVVGNEHTQTYYQDSGGIHDTGDF